MVWAVLNRVLRLFYDRRFLTGRYFTASRGGYLWALRGVLWQKVLGFNRKARYPVAPFNTVSNPANLMFHPDDLNNLQGSGKYFQCNQATITIGRGTYIANNVGIITENHDLDNLDAHGPALPVVIGEGCWIAMNAVILPGITLGDRTIVGAGAIVTRSHPEGAVVLAGNPARPIRSLAATDDGK